MRGLQTVICVLVAMGLLASASAHVSTFAGIDPQNEYGVLAPLALGIIGVVALWAIISRSRRGVKQQEAKAKRLPGSLIALYFLLGAYMTFCLTVWMEPERRTVTVIYREDGTAYLATGHGRRYLREIDNEGIRWRSVLRTRSITGWLTACYAMAAVAIVYARQKEECASGNCIEATMLAEPTAEPMHQVRG